MEVAMAPRVLIPLAEGSEELEAITISDLLRRAEVEVVVAGLTEGPIRCSRGTVIIPDATLEAVKDDHFDLIALPGGLPGADHLNEDPRVHAVIKRMNAEGKFTTAICAAPTVLASAGVLKGKKATSFPRFLDQLQAADAEAIAIRGVVHDGNVITSTGPGTAMDFALKLIEVLCGEERLKQVEAGLQRP
uniref:DJ-1/PfpI domain-containing protein n=1 Tax=Magnetococcus massalia (strain MO-1) TaxID=451514 RepID=A0A1S7LFW1_MAGMO|nr:Putative protein DJ-1, belongs to ThiJ/PfpI family [yajL/thiJ ] [Candidatus Magnetococcus massalia]